MHRVHRTAVARKRDLRPVLFPPLRDPTSAAPVCSRWSSRPLTEHCATNAATQSRNGCQTFFACSVLKPARIHSDLERVVGTYVGLLAPMLVEEMLAIES